MTLEILYIVAAVITIGGAFVGLARIRMRRVDRLRAEHADLEHVVGAFVGAVLAAHGRLVMLAQLRRSWIPISQGAVVTFGDSLLSEVRPVAELRSHIRAQGGTAVNNAADEVMAVLEDTAVRLSRGRMAVRKATMDDCQASLEKAVLNLQRSVSKE